MPPASDSEERERYQTVQIVRCPRCRQLLPEYSDITIYRCGGCGIVLQAKGALKGIADIKSSKEEALGDFSGTKSSEKEEKSGTYQPSQAVLQGSRTSAVERMDLPGLSLVKPSSSRSPPALLPDEDYVTDSSESEDADAKTILSISEADIYTGASASKAAFQRQQPEIAQMHARSHSHFASGQNDVPIDMTLEAMMENEIVNLSVEDMKIDRTLNQILEYIKDSGVGKIGIYGRSGVGKTTVMEVLMYEPVIREMFDHVIWVSVPKVWDVKEVQVEIAKQVSFMGTVDAHPVRLIRLLNRAKFLLFLDDVGEQINLKMVGIPEPTPENGSKIVLTTRSEQVCHIMDVNVKIQLEDLLSWELFCENVGEVVNASNIQPVARHIVEICSHYSQAIILTARALKDVSDVNVWTNLCERLSIHHASLGTTEENLMVSVFKFSYERLEDDLTRNCLRTCALYNEKQEIVKNSLIDHWISNGLIGTHEKGKKIMKNLIDANLLNSVEGGVFVKLQGIVRHILVNLIIQPEECRLFLMRGGLGLTEPPKDEEWENAKEIYLMQNELSELPENPKCPILSALFLQRNYKLRMIPPSFFQYMPALQVLNLSRTRIKSLPESLFRLVNLKRLYVNDCDLLMTLSAKVGDLKHLEVLDLEGTEIMYLPKEVEKLTNLKCLDVSFYCSRRSEQKDTVIHRGTISALTQLEELNVHVNPDDERWDLCVGAIIKEVLSLKSLSTLTFYFPRVEMLENFKRHGSSMLYPSLSRFRFIVGHHANRIMKRIPCDIEFELERWDRCLKYVNGVGIPSEIKRVLRRATLFYLDRHTTLTKLSDFGTENMEQLKCCVLGECNELQVIIDGEEVLEEDIHGREIASSSDSDSIICLESLEYLYIYYMKNLRSIWEGSVWRCFRLLKSLTLHTCPQLTTIFTHGMLHNFRSLEELTVEDCPAITSIVSFVDPARYKSSCFLPKLKRISLHYMPEFVSISCGLGIAPKLEWMSIYNCPKLKSLSAGEMCSKNMKKIKAERSWWETLEWINGLPDHLNGIFVPIDECN